MDKRWLRRNMILSFLYIVGILILSLGVSLIIISNLGIGAWESLNVGLSKSFPISVALAYALSGGMLVLVNAVMLKSMPDITAFLTSSIIGLAVNLWLNALGHLHILTDTLTLRLIGLLAGLLATSTGVAIYLVSGFGRSPVDGFMFAISKVFGLSISMSKTIDGAIGLALAIIFGGPIGVGTIAFTFLLGPLIQPQYSILSARLQSKLMADA